MKVLLVKMRRKRRHAEHANDKCEEIGDHDGTRDRGHHQHNDQKSLSPSAKHTHTDVAAARDFSALLIPNTGMTYTVAEMMLMMYRDEHRHCDEP